VVTRSAHIRLHQHGEHLKPQPVGSFETLSLIGRHPGIPPALREHAVRIPLKKLPKLLRDLLIPLQVGQVDGVSADRGPFRNRPPTTHPRTSLARFGAQTQEEDRLERSQSRAWPRPPAPPRPRSQSWT